MTKYYFCNSRKSRFKCGVHGITTFHHLPGIGCPKYRNEEASAKQRRTPDQSLAQCKKRHGGKYDYSKAEFGTGHNKIEIICPDHGSFFQRLDAHIAGQDCPQCKGKKISKALIMSQDDWLDKAIEVHEDRYDYSRVNYIGWDRKVEIICPIHGSFEQRAGDHIKGKGCQKCGFLKISKTKRMSEEQWIEKARKVHEDFYDYSLVNYKGSWKPVEIICPEHGVFSQKAACHTTMWHGCPKCGGEKQARGQEYSTDDFVLMAKKVHGERYDYSEAVYHPRKGGIQQKTKIICPNHGPFSQAAHMHLQGNGCPECKTERLKKLFILSKEDFISRARKLHGMLYNYERTNYRGIKEHVEIICKRHGAYRQRAEDHLNGNGCPRCKHSSGAKAIAAFLERYDIKFEVEKRFPSCKRSYKLPFDFYLPAACALIEYDGEQHFVPARWFKDKRRAIERLNYIRDNDRIKDEWTKKNNIPLYRIHYNEDVVSKIEEICRGLNLLKNNK